jgi:hypothetical protein
MRSLQQAGADRTEALGARLNHETNLQQACADRTEALGVRLSHVPPP